jgi:hypothetical protein
MLVPAIFAHLDSTALYTLVPVQIRDENTGPFPVQNQLS